MSVPGAAYFVTGCIVGRQSVLAVPVIAHAIRAHWKESDATGDTATFAATVMPDHFHWFFQLGERLTLGRVLAKFKVRTKASLHNVSASWQRDFFEHHLRSADSSEEYGIYIFMNPYRARLVTTDATWLGWHCPDPSRFRFTMLLDEVGCPPREWLELPEREDLHVGE